MIHVKLSSIYREAVGCKRLQVAVEPGGTLRDVISVLGVHSPRFTHLVTNRRGELKASIVILLNGESVQHREGLDTRLPDGAEIVVLPVVEGG